MEGEGKLCTKPWEWVFCQASIIAACCPTLFPGQQLHFNKGNRSLVQENSREMASSSAPRTEEGASLLLSKIRDSMIRGPIHSEGTHCHVLYNRDSEYYVTI